MRPHGDKNWRPIGRLQGLGMVLCLLVWVESTAGESPPPLLKQAKSLSCAKTEPMAKAALSTFWAIEDADNAFPDEHRLGRDNSTLHAATLDIVLKSLVETSVRFPALRNQVERTLLKWNYCDVFQGGEFYNLERKGHKLIRTKAAAHSPEQWAGFKILGFLGDHERRFIPNILAIDQQGLRSDYEWLFHRIFREQCFPHPDTSALFDAQEQGLQENIAPKVDGEAVAFPYQWSAECVHARLPPDLATTVRVELMPVTVPTLLSTLNIIPTPPPVTKVLTQAVPPLLTTIEFSPVAYKVPQLKSRVILETVAVRVPQLKTSLKLDKPKPKPVLKQPKKVSEAPARMANNRGGFVGNNGSGQPYKYVAKQQKFVNPQHITKPTIALDTNASLLERILGGLASGGNVLIVDKIQLTVNEYNGTVETAISSSDIGANAEVMDTKPALVRELLHALPVKQKQPATRAMPMVQKRPATTPPRPQKKVSKPSPYLLVPELQSMLLVSHVETLQQPVPVTIRNKAKQAKRGKTKTRYASKREKPKTQQKKRNTSSSVFTYTPYPSDEPKAKEKSIEQLLREYQAYEERRKSGRLRKKKQLGNDHQTLLDVPQLTPRVSWTRPLSKKIEVPPLETEVWIKNANTIPVTVPSLQSKVYIYKKYTTQPVKVPVLNTMVIQQNLPTQPAVQPVGSSFDFLPDEVFEDTLISPRVSSQVAAPIFLTSGAPLPYVIEENFMTDLPVNKAAKKKNKSKQSKVKTKKLGLAGNVYLKHSLKNSNSAVGGSINRKLIKDNYWFARVGWNYRLEESDDPFTYSWGTGYSDWHSGTFSAQLNNWGPIKPGEGLALEKAVANFGYSVKSAFLKKHKLGLSGAINVPVEGNSSISGNLRWSPIKNWYINTSVSHPLEGDGTPKWTYGFGYSDWRPNKFNFQYSNYGPNEIFDHNYEENGTWALSYNWKL